MANMVTTYNWLKEHAPFKLSESELADQLTDIGIEVEESRPLGAAIEGVVVGVVEKATPHPNADRLSLCRVATGTETLDVVCGAANVAPGQKIAFATPGTVLPSGLKIGKRKIRGQDSSGMICSEAELGLAEQTEGIMVLPENSELGTPYPAKTTADHLLVLEITPNRPDLLSVRGLARDICASLGIKPTSPPLPDLGLDFTAKGVVPVEIKQAELCPRYTGLVIRGTKPGPAPAWLAERLQAIGQRPISNIVDATNLVLFELGHPLHAFDLGKLAGPEIIVRTANKGEKITAIDGQEYKLTKEMLVIADREKPVALAGIMGGADSEVNETTTDILLECATFNPACVRRTSRNLGLNSESSLRFCRGVDPEGVPAALQRAAQIILETAGGKTEAAVTDNYPQRSKQVSVDFSPTRCDRLLGTKIERGEMKRMLSGLGLNWSESGKDKVKLSIPSYRPDLTRQADISEELARLQGYDKLTPTLPQGPLPAALARQPAQLRAPLREFLRHRGYQEVILPSLEPCRGETNALRLIKPLTEDMACLRTSPLPSLLALLARQAAARPEGLRFFEFGRVFRKSEDTPTQEITLAGICYGKRDLSSWAGAKHDLDIFDIKGLVSGLLNELGDGKIKFSPLDNAPGLSPNNLLAVSQKKQQLGLLGQIHPQQTAAFKRLRAAVFYFEIYPWRLKLPGPNQKIYQSFPRYPRVQRDIALIIPDTVPAERVVKLIRQSGGETLSDVRPFDYYQGEQVGQGNYSLSLHLTYQGATGTLTDEQVETACQAMLKQLAQELSAKVREK